MPGRRDEIIGSLLYQEDREKILSMVRKMGNMVSEALASAVQSLEGRDNALADRIIEADDIVDDLEVEIDQECLSSIALRQPLRKDLRFVFAVLKIITDLERVGDQAVNIAKRAKALNRYPLLKPLIDIPKMRDIATGMLRDALTSFEEEDPALAEEVCLRDEALDILDERIFDELTGIMAGQKIGDAGVVQRAAGLMWVSRHLARVGDHATNVSERAYFMVRGERLKPLIEARKKAAAES